MVTSNGTESADALRNNLESPYIPKDDRDYPLDDVDGENLNYIQIKITCPNLGPKCSKTFRFCLLETVWVAKQTVLVEFSVNPNLQDPLNFGFYLPPHAGRAGKFLDEERKLSEYPMDSIEAHLEFRYKRRIFRHLYAPDEKKLVKANSKKYRKRFIEVLQGRNIQEMQKMFEKGLDPNFHEERTGDTPLIIAAMMDDCIELLKLLIQFGAYLDFRSLKGKTAIHIVSAAGKLDVLKHFKALGASPNYKDGKGLTPLYHSILCAADIKISEHLLNDKARIGVSDIHGSEEIHQACKLGLAQHLELLILHGADVNSRTASGNTPLHICVLENRLNCVRILLRHGADHKILNYAQQSAYGVSVIVNHFEIGQVLRKLDSPEDLTEPGSPGVDQDLSACNKSYSDSALPSNTSFGDNVEMGDSTEGHRKASKDSIVDHDEASDYESDSDDEEKLKPEKQYRSFSNAGIGTKRSPAPMKIRPLGTPTLRKRLYASVPGRQFLVVNDYEPKHSGELGLKKGDLLEVLYIGDNGYWEGHINGRGGWFPSYCVQEVKHNDNHLPRQLSWFGKKSPTEGQNVIPNYPPSARTVILKRSDKGFGFQLRGANSHVPYINFVPSPQYPALQYIGDVDKGGVADKAGLKPGDFVLEINNENVVNATHGYAVSLINKNSEKGLTIKVISVVPECVNSEVIITNSGSKSKNILEVRERDATDGGSTNTKTGPPTPPLRSFSTTLSLPARVHSDAALLLAEGSVATTAETVTLGKSSVSRKPSVKGIWSGNAFRLQGNDVQIREENISRGISRKQKAVSTADKLPEYDDVCKPVASKLPTFDKDFRISANCNIKSNELSENPPDYNSTVENLRSGRANSLGKGDGIKLTRSHTLDHDCSKQRQYIRPDASAIFSNHDYQNQQFATLRNHNQSKQGLYRSHSHQGSVNTSKPIDISLVTCDTPVQQSNSHLPRRESAVSNEIHFNPVDYDTIISHQDGDEVDSIPVVNNDDWCPESDGLIRLQNMRQVKGPPVLPKPVSSKQLEPIATSRNDSSSCASTDSIYSKDSGYEASDNDHTTLTLSAIEPELTLDTCDKPMNVENYSNSSLSNVVDSATSYLDVVIADAEASLNYDIISPPSSSHSQVDPEECCSSDSNSALSSPNSGNPTEFPPPPEFLANDDVTNNDSDDKIPSMRNDNSLLSDPPPPYTPYMGDPIAVVPAIVNVPSTLQNKSYMEWTCDDVCIWLEHLSLGQYRDTFVDNDIEGKHLAELTKDELKELGVSKLGHRMTLDDAIAKLCRNAP